MSQNVRNLPEEKILPTPEPIAPLARPGRVRSSNVGAIGLLVLISLSLLLFSAQIVFGLRQLDQERAAQAAQAQLAVSEASPVTTQGGAPTPTATPGVPFVVPSNATIPPLQLPAERYVVYQSSTHIFLFSTTDKTVLIIDTPDYLYNRVVPPILTPGNQLLYVGSHGIWLTDIFTQQHSQVASLEANMVVASLALSQDGTAIAWSTEPADGTGQMNLYAGPLASPQLISQQSTLDCPCFRIFSFLNGTSAGADHTLLLTDDRGSNGALQYGLWSLDIADPAATPQLMMDEYTQQGPLAFAPNGSALLYAPYEGAVPVPADSSVPADVAALSYADRMSITVLNGSTLNPDNSLIVLSNQKKVAKSVPVQWVTTPVFSPDGHTLAYVEFSSDTQAPYDRHSALYTVQISGSGSHMQIGPPHLVSISTAKLLELGSWLNDSIVTLYGDGALYALDVQSGALTTLTQPGGYLRLLGTFGVGSA